MIGLLLTLISLALALLHPAWLVVAAVMLALTLAATVVDFVRMLKRTHYGRRPDDPS